jgi:hypothetical protein
MILATVGGKKVETYVSGIQLYADPDATGQIVPNRTYRLLVLCL